MTYPGHEHDPEPAMTFSERPRLFALAQASRATAPCFACVLDARRRQLGSEQRWIVDREGVKHEHGSELDARYDLVGPPDGPVEGWPLYWRRLLERSGADLADLRAHTCGDRDLCFWLDAYPTPAPRAQGRAA